jgi:hypothetical protein
MTPATEAAIRAVLLKHYAWTIPMIRDFLATVKAEEKRQEGAKEG